MMHTKGPWVAEWDYGDKAVGVAPTEPYIVSESGQPIASVDCREVEDGEAEANAKLIAAAPALLGALEDDKHMHEHADVRCERCMNAQTKCRAAIEAAK